MGSSPIAVGGLSSQIWVGLLIKKNRTELVPGLVLNFLQIFEAEEHFFYGIMVVRGGMSIYGIFIIAAKLQHFRIYYIIR